MSGRDKRGGGRNSTDNKNNNCCGGHDNNRRQQDERPRYIKRVVTINRASKTVKGDRHFSFTVLVIVGDGKGMVGVGYGKAKEASATIQKGVEKARKNFFHVSMIADTITHPIQGGITADIVLLYPTVPGTDLIVGGAVRPALECAGVRDVLSKSLGISNSIDVVRATIGALK